MVITYHNDTCFRISSGKLNLVIDPVSEKFKSDITLITKAKISDPDLSGKQSEKSDVTIFGGGEYEIQEVMVRGIQANYEEKSGISETIYVVDIENVSILFMGNISSVPDSETISKIGDIDILFIPVGKENIDPKNAAKLVKQIEPSITVPYPHKQINAFLDELGKKCETMDKLTIKKKDIVEMGDKEIIVSIKA